jgi:hypothetical protein
MIKASGIRWTVEWVFKGYTGLTKGLKEALDATKIPYKLIPKFRLEGGLPDCSMAKCAIADTVW